MRMCVGKTVRRKKPLCVCVEHTGTPCGGTTGTRVVRGSTELHFSIYTFALLSRFSRIPAG